MHVLIAAATALSLAHGALSINKPVTQQVAASEEIETVCISNGDKPVLITVRAKSGNVRLRAGDGPWFKATTHITNDEDGFYIYVMATNENGTLVVRYGTDGAPAHIGFAFNNGRRTTYGATCVSHFR